MAEFLDWDAGDLLAAMRRGELRATDVMAATLDRIAARNGAVNAIVDLRDRNALMQEAAAADAVASPGPLNGLPIAIKALVDVKGMRNTEGSPLFEARMSTADARYVQLMREAGAIFIGKTNVPEFGLGSHSYNPVHGVTRNPFNSERTAGGSSGGAGAALSMGMVALADGSDMMGSLRNPAGWNNVYGLRPSWGAVPRDPGGDTFWKQISTHGAMARSPRDIALLMDVMARPDSRVPLNLPEREWTLPETCSAEGRRIGWLGDWDGAFPMEDGILAQCESGLQVFEALGADVSPLAAPFDAEDLFAAWSVLRAYALVGDIGALYDDPAKRVRLKPEAQWEVRTGLALSVPELHKACALRSAWFERAATLFQDCDVLALPVAQCWPFPTGWEWPRQIAGVTMDTYHRWMHVMVPVSLAGLPAISIPVGFGSNGLPMGVQLFAAKGNDGMLLEVAQAYHEATLWPQKHLSGLAGA